MTSIDSLFLPPVPLASVLLRVFQVRTDNGLKPWQAIQTSSLE